jgi:hypothetical protein
MIQIPKDHMAEWLSHPVTKKVFESLRKVRADHQSVLNDGGTLDTSSAEKTALQTALLLGKISGINVLIETVIEEE